MTAQKTSAARPTMAMLKNVAAIYTLAEELRSRPPHLPGIGVVHAPSGYGKTHGAIYVQNRMQALRVEVGDSWTKRTLLQRILIEAGQQPHGTIADMAEQAIMFLGDDPLRPLIIDEADKLVDKGMIELVREIHEHSQAPILLIGEELLPAKLARIERTHNRILSWVAAQPCDAEDTRALANLFCEDLKLSDDLLEAIRTRSEGRARRIVVNLNRIIEFARQKGTRSLDLKGYSGGAFFTGQPPQQRHLRAA
jgi:DNA transposition AAA+ family ATPase